MDSTHAADSFSPGDEAAAMNRADPRVVPVYALTKGRTRSVGRDQPWETLITTTAAGVSALARLRFEQARILRVCRRPMLIAEVAAELGVPVGVARVLVSDLYAEGLLVMHIPTFDASGRPRRDVLHRLLTGLEGRAGNSRASSRRQSRREVERRGPSALGASGAGPLGPQGAG